MQAIEVKGFFTSYRGWMVLGAGLLVIVAWLIATMQLDPSAHDNDGAAAIAVNLPTSQAMDRADWLAQHRAVASPGHDTSVAAGDRADIIAGSRGERPVAPEAATADRADTIEQLRGQAPQHRTPRMDRADTIEALRRASAR
jgi:hypothetical protein